MILLLPSTTTDRRGICAAAERRTTALVSQAHCFPARRCKSHCFPAWLCESPYCPARGAAVIHDAALPPPPAAPPPRTRMNALYELSRSNSSCRTWWAGRAAAAQQAPRSCPCAEQEPGIVYYRSRACNTGTGHAIQEPCTFDGGTGVNAGIGTRRCQQEPGDVHRSLVRPSSGHLLQDPRAFHRNQALSTGTGRFRQELRYLHRSLA